MPTKTPKELLLIANEVAMDALAEGHHPFGAILVDRDGETVLMRQGNVDTVRHAESELARNAARSYSREFLWHCTLVTTFEPCAMCSGTIYWANIGTVLYGASESTLKSLTGDDPENPTMNLPCRHVLGSGQKRITVLGPFPELKETMLQPHRDFWKGGSKS